MSAATGIEGDRRLGGECSISMSEVNGDDGGTCLRCACGDRQVQKTVVVEISRGECSAERNIVDFWSSETSIPRIGSKDQFGVAAFTEEGSDGHKIGKSAVPKSPNRKSVMLKVPSPTGE